MMFAPFCPTHDTNVLMTRRNVLSFWNGPDGPVIRWKCNCGHEGIMNADGSTADASQTGDAAAIRSQVPTDITALATSAGSTGRSVDTLVNPSTSIDTSTARIGVDAEACCA